MEEWEKLAKWQLLEETGPKTASEFARILGLKPNSAAVWLSRMTSVKQENGTRKSYLIYEPPKVKSHRVHFEHIRNEGTYRINPDCDWRELFKHVEIM